ncbi:hypothetical protein B0J18DRAFT_20422 [Chaetomium sp. MPI-SDFR-AT-0129]|nr:hypothetical protein B0J18DRAFT_20422 [Chaetomium sp. MPI-SDFR-AT-0129]
MRLRERKMPCFLCCAFCVARTRLSGSRRLAWGAKTRGERTPLWIVWGSAIEFLWNCPGGRLGWSVTWTLHRNWLRESQPSVDIGTLKTRRCGRVGVNRCSVAGGRGAEMQENALREINRDCSQNWDGKKSCCRSSSKSSKKSKPIEAWVEKGPCAFLGVTCRLGLLGC